MEGHRVKLTEVNPHLVCVLCHGYFVDATTIAECLHSFCRSCIFRYLQVKSYCPICEVQVHNTKLHLSLKPDKTLQDIVYKLVPGLFHNEMRRRREFYKKHPHRDEYLEAECRGVGLDRLIYSPEDMISLSLEFYDPEKEKEEWTNRTNPKILQQQETSTASKRYLQCPAGFKMAHLKKFLRQKYNLPPTWNVDIIYRRETLPDSLSLMDIAYIYTWKRNGPMRFYYTLSGDVVLTKEEAEKISESASTPVSNEAGGNKVSEAIPREAAKEPESNSKEARVNTEEEVKGDGRALSKQDQISVSALLSLGECRVEGKPPKQEADFALPKVPPNKNGLKTDPNKKSNGRINGKASVNKIASELAEHKRQNGNGSSSVSKPKSIIVQSLGMQKSVSSGGQSPRANHGAPQGGQSPRPNQVPQGGQSPRANHGVSLGEQSPRPNRFVSLGGQSPRAEHGVSQGVPARANPGLPSGGQSPRPNQGVPLGGQSPRGNHGVSQGGQSPRTNHGVSQGVQSARANIQGGQSPRPQGGQSPRTNRGVSAGGQSPRVNHGISQMAQSSKSNIGVAQGQSPRTNQGFVQNGHSPRGQNYGGQSPRLSNGCVGGQSPAQSPRGVHGGSKTSKPVYAPILVFSPKPVPDQGAQSPKSVDHPTQQSPLPGNGAEQIGETRTEPTTQQKDNFKVPNPPKPAVKTSPPHVKSPPPVSVPHINGLTSPKHSAAIPVSVPTTESAQSSPLAVSVDHTPQPPSVQVSTQKKSPVTDRAPTPPKPVEKKADHPPTDLPSTEKPDQSVTLTKDPNKPEIVLNMSNGCLTITAQSDTTDTAASHPAKTPLSPDGNANGAQTNNSSGIRMNGYSVTITPEPSSKPVTQEKENGGTIHQSNNNNRLPTFQKNNWPRKTLANGQVNGKVSGSTLDQRIQQLYNAQGVHKSLPSLPVMKAPQIAQVQPQHTQASQHSKQGSRLANWLQNRFPPTPEKSMKIPHQKPQEQVKNNSPAPADKKTESMDEKKSEENTPPVRQVEKPKNDTGPKGKVDSAKSGTNKGDSILQKQLSVGKVDKEVTMLKRKLEELRRNQDGICEITQENPKPDLAKKRRDVTPDVSIELMRGVDLKKEFTIQNKDQMCGSSVKVTPKDKKRPIPGLKAIQESDLKRKAAEDGEGGLPKKVKLSNTKESCTPKKGEGDSALDLSKGSPQEVIQGKMQNAIAAMTAHQPPVSLHWFFPSRPMLHPQYLPTGGK